MGKMQHVDMKWNSYYYFCNQVPCNFCLDFAETLAFFCLDPTRRRLPLPYEFADEADRGRLLVSVREDWGVTCEACTEGAGFAKMERLLLREEADALATGRGWTGEEDRETREL